MNLHDAERLAVSLMQEHGLFEQGWRFRWSTGKRQLGAAHVRHVRDRRTGRTTDLKTIRLSHHLVMLNDEAEVRDTILHEIAHALAGVERGHDARWRAVCRRIGARPQRLAGEHVATVAGRYHVICPRCSRTLAQRHRRPARTWRQRAYCRHCGPDTIGKLQLRDARL